MSTNYIMELIIYRLYTKNDSTEKNISMDKTILNDHPSPKLVKFGFNKTTDNFDIIGLTQNEHYRIGLKFDFDRSDKESIISVGKKVFNISNIDQNFCIFWEILNLFGMLSLNQNILTDIKNCISGIVSVFKKMTDSKVTSKVHETVPPKEKISLVIKKYSDIDLEEDATVDLIINDLKNIFSNLETGSSLILQIFSCQTLVMVELIYYLTSLYKESYIIKPMTSSDLSNEKYLVLCNLKKNAKMFDAPKLSSNTFISSFGISLPNYFTTIIQCINSELIPKIYGILSY